MPFINNSQVIINKENILENQEAIADILNNVIQYDKILGEYVNLDEFWDRQKDGRIYTVEFNQYITSPSPTGTKLNDNAGLVCEPSTNILKGQNDYENIGLFRAIDVNAYVDENDDYHVTAIKGDDKFQKDGTNGDVYVMSMAGYIKRVFADDVWSLSYSDMNYSGYEILDEAVKVDGTVKSYLLHAKYIAGIGLDGKLASISGVPAEYGDMSHNGQITQFLSKGSQYSGKTSHDDFYTSLMFYLKYATANNETVMKGCISYSYTYNNLLAETGVKRVVITNAQANTLLIGSTVEIATDTRFNITEITDLGDGNSAIYVDADTVFDTTLSTKIATKPWNAGSCDDVLGVDGSPTSVTSGKEPFVINGIEIMVGGYEVLQNLIIYNNNTDAEDYKIQVYANYDCNTYATSPDTNYDLLSLELPQTDASWQYVSKIGVSVLHPSVIMPIESVASSTTGFADSVYTNSPITGYREWRSFGNLGNGSFCGLRSLLASSSLDYSYWFVLGRLSATGRSHRRAGVN